MKKLQNNFTTPEQSKRLLELGVPADSADCYYYQPNSSVYIDGSMPRYFIDKNATYFIIKEIKERVNRCFKMLPCWSVGRLMEIAHVCSDNTLSYKEEANEIQKFKEEHKCETLIETVIVCIADAVSIGSINFSKLEE